MTASGLSTYNPAVTDIIAKALKALGVIADGEVPTGDMFQDALSELNGIVAAAQATGAHVWTEQEAILFVQPGQVKYQIGAPSLNANTSDADSWIRLTLANSVQEGATAIVIQDPDDIPVAGIVGANIGIILNDNSTFWTTVASVVGSTINLGTAIPEQGATSGAFALVYETAIVRPLKVPRASLIYLNGMNETPMTVMSRQGYMDQPNKFSPGVPTQFFYTPQLDRGWLYLWPAPQNSLYGIRFTWYRPLQDFFNPGDTMDFPQEWIAPLRWILARDLMGSYDTPPPRSQYIMQQAAQYSDLALSYDRESEPIEFGMDWTFTQGA